MARSLLRDARYARTDKHGHAGSLSAARAHRRWLEPAPSSRETDEGAPMNMDLLDAPEPAAEAARASRASGAAGSVV
jgi:hypothetical protein